MTPDREQKKSKFNSITIIDDAFNPPIFANLAAEIQDLLSDPEHPETAEIIQILIARGIIPQPNEGEAAALEHLQATASLARLLEWLEVERPEQAERFFGKYLADRRHLLELRKRLEDSGASALSISCIGPTEISQLDTLPDLIFLDLVLWRDLEERQLIEGVVKLLKELNPSSRTSPLFVILMSERDVKLKNLSDSLRIQAELSINQFRAHSKASLMRDGGLTLPLALESLYKLRGITAAQLRLASSLDHALCACGAEVKAMVLRMEDGDFRYLEELALLDHVSGADYLAELAGSFLEHELEGNGPLSGYADACFAAGVTTAALKPPPPHIASTQVVRELFVRSSQRFAVPPGIRDSIRPRAKDPSARGREWQAWLRRFLPPGLVVGSEEQTISEGSRVYVHLSQDCDTLQEPLPQSRLSLLFLPADIFHLDNVFEDKSDRLPCLLVRIANKDWILKMNLRQISALGVEQAYRRITTKRPGKSTWYPLALLRSSVTDGLRRKLANHLNRPAEPKIHEQRFSWNLTGVLVRIDSHVTATGPIAITCMLVRAKVGKKTVAQIRLPHEALCRISDLLEGQELRQLKADEVLGSLTDALAVEQTRTEVGSAEGPKRATKKINLTLAPGPVKKAEVELVFEKQEYDVLKPGA
jgi:hypothetical protein